MKIALIHFRAGFTDGVSLEMEKWKRVLEELGHEVMYVAGEFDQAEGIEIRSLSMNDATNLQIHKNAFEKLTVSERTFQEMFENYAGRIEAELREKLPRLDLLIVNNIFSLGFNLAAAVALAKFVRDKNLKVIAHHHDFYWERERYSAPRCEYVKRILEEYLPPRDELILHVTINRLAQEELRRRKNTDSVVVPNVFDFNQPAWRIDEYNLDLRSVLGISRDDLVILHATRIVPRKAIEIAMDFVAHLCERVEKKVHFVLAGFPEMESQEYYRKIVRKAESMPYETHFAFEMVRSERFVNDRKYYSLWDMYAICDVITYTSLLEGWGNQLIEAVFAKKPLVVFEYPVYKSDIAPLGFQFVSLGDTAHYDETEGLYRVDAQMLNSAAERLKELLSDPSELSTIVEKNFETGRTHLSLERLKLLLGQILNPKNLATTFSLPEN
ncbi:MAG: Glycosyl transferase group 1 [Thermotoga sp. 50_1627]|uniref:glycosyltransferase family 4 protein n=1 Tax=Pseudothermotoga sp. TaxID=2033661 RepID=UPI00076C955D|nr:MAG: Glycosyl transferase group 1 [Thermotoga sp. 50_1627]MBC7116689.1 glycosyltransferase family 4 protein [Pseudothermotoga sp.]MDK2922730.1 mannosylglucosylglycerate synthase [Pseudothermotoga sp.]HBT39274.1 glycosyl transferase family 1 [Pseudothermotoga sp.]HCO97620.1 glycosyl transferase family 1 [Pseudothermotoga sp.]